jgi:hypothetical protein
MFIQRSRNFVLLLPPVFTIEVASASVILS